MKSLKLRPVHPNWDDEFPNCGVRAATFMGDPRINEKQMAEIVNAVAHDNHALIMGMDENTLPVVRARVGKPSKSRSWAIRRNGDPTTPGPIHEVWNQG